ncbi:MAG: biotin/lipoyl-containing protein, partial [Clostridia bacterium]
MAVDVVVPPLGESLVEATVGTWLKKVGDPVTMGEPLLELETDKVNLEVAATAAGVLADIQAESGATVAPGDVLGHVDEASSAAAQAPAATAPPAPTPAPEPEPAPAETAVRATPAVRRLAEERGVSLESIAATGAHGRVRREDVERAGQAAPTAAPAPEPREPKTSVPAEPVPAAPSGAVVERVRMSRRRLTIARRLVETKQNAAMLTTF